MFLLMLTFQKMLFLLERQQLEKKLNPAGQSLTQSFWVEKEEKAALAGWRQLCSKLVRRSHHCGRRLVAPCSTGAPSLLLYNILACLESREVQATQP